MGEKKDRETHPSFANVSFTRFQTSGFHSFFGSNLKNSNGVSLKITKCDWVRDESSGQDFYFPNGLPYIEVWLTESQFAQLLTTMNRGEGVPCTLKYRNGEEILPPPYVSRAQESLKEFKIRTDRVMAHSRRLCGAVSEYAKERKLNKAQWDNLEELVKALERELGSSMRFSFQIFNEMTDKTLNEAKAMIDGYISENLKKLGIDALQGTKLLPENGDSENDNSSQ